MWSIIMSMLTEAYLACVGWFNQFVIKVPGFLATWTIIFTIYTLTRMIIIPVAGNALGEINTKLYTDLKNKRE